MYRAMALTDVMADAWIGTTWRSAVESVFGSTDNLLLHAKDVVVLDESPQAGPALNNKTVRRIQVLKGLSVFVGAVAAWSQPSR